MTIVDLKTRLNNLGVPDEVYDFYKEPHRYYHTLTHLDDIFTQILEKGLSGNDALLLATVYHDIIYDPQSSTNEEDSAQYFINTFSGSASLKADVVQIILDTKTHQSSSKLSTIFCEMDLNILRQPFAKLLEYECQIFKEFQFVDYKLYQAKRIEILEKLRLQVDNPALDFLIEYVRNRKPSIAVYPGSFNPFHKGHLNILQKAERIFDKVIIARGINPEKAKASYNLPALLNYRQMETYSTLLTDFVKQLGYSVTIIRGLRNGTDLQFELNQYRYLQDLTNTELNIISIFCDREFEHISSTGIRQLDAYGQADKYLLL
ncbi:adenylyltransferase/cytidyltransferase family protein [Mucilaginibacter robiniae]|uniref:Phosphopantetheine adenylyltransferase n=1 Tax=Mucilaginibacter robiniae TaxID=2728022 RepID=A0A7L5E615_9SPHI|nr:adenylyltransferase/cytidyltransferase family protein [Mucilaginibacter robiniae]QJD97827.1 adenylyltransferase/cytidyltransferase family protein [Mucilaginibacter robiniae]